MTIPATINYEALARRGDEEDEPKYSGSFYRREPIFMLRNTGDTAILRPLAESPDWYKGLTHPFVPVTKGKPEGYEGKWPEGMSATCRKDPMLAAYYPEGCPICTSPFKTKFDKTMEEARQDQRYTLMVEREEVVGDGTPEMGGPEFLGKKGYQDKMVEVPVYDAEGKPTKETVKRPSIVIVSGTMYSMFGALKATGEAHGSLRNNDFRVKRTPNPTGRGDTYLWVGLPAIPSINPTTPAWQIYMDAVANWVPGGLSVARFIGERSSAAYYDRFWTTNGVFQFKPVPASTSNGFAPATSPAPGAGSIGSAPVSEEVDQDKLAAMRARVMGAAAAAAPSTDEDADSGSAES